MIMKEQIKQIVDVDSILNNIFFTAYQKNEKQFLQEIKLLNQEEKLKVFTYLIVNRNYRFNLLEKMLNKDKQGDLVNSNINNLPLIVYFSEENITDLTKITLEHKAFNVRVFDNIEHLKVFVKKNQKNDAILFSLIENHPDLTLIKNLKGFKLNAKINNMLEAAYLNHTVSQDVKQKTTTLKI